MTADDTWWHMMTVDDRRWQMMRWRASSIEIPDSFYGLNDRSSYENTEKQTGMKKEGFTVSTVTRERLLGFQSSESIIEFVDLHRVADCIIWILTIRYICTYLARENREHVIITQKQDENPDIAQVMSQSWGVMIDIFESRSLSLYLVERGISLGSYAWLYLCWTQHS